MTDYLNKRALETLQVIASEHLSADESRLLARRALDIPRHRLSYTPTPWSVVRNYLGHLEPFSGEGVHLLSSEGENPLPLKERHANAAIIEHAASLLQAVCGLLEGLEPSSGNQFTGHSEAFLRIVAIPKAKEVLRAIEHWEEKE